MPLTDIAIRSAKPLEKPQRLFDGGGLYLEISPAGGKWWRFKYRFEGKEKRLSLGTYPDIGLKEARERRDGLRRQLANGVDPGINRKTQKEARAQRAADSFETIAREWFAMNLPTWAESHASKIIRRLEVDVFPWLGGKAIAEISAPDVLKVLRRIESRGTLDTALRARSNCSQVFRYAIQTGRAERDPVPDLRGAIPALRHSNFASLTEPAKVAELLRAMDGFKGTFVVKSALLLSPLFFVRPGELRRAQWSEFDFDKAEWRYFVTKTKTEHLVHVYARTDTREKRCYRCYSVTRYINPLFRKSFGCNIDVTPKSKRCYKAAVTPLVTPKNAARCYKKT